MRLRAGFFVFVGVCAERDQSARPLVRVGSTYKWNACLSCLGRRLREDATRGRGGRRWRPESAGQERPRAAPPAPPSPRSLTGPRFRTARLRPLTTADGNTGPPASPPAAQTAPQARRLVPPTFLRLWPPWADFGPPSLLCLVDYTCLLRPPVLTAAHRWRPARVHKQNICTIRFAGGRPHRSGRRAAAANRYKGGN